VAIADLVKQPDLGETYMRICIFAYIDRKVDKSATTAGDHASGEDTDTSNASDAGDASDEEMDSFQEEQKVEAA
jgi:hypothetical protein